MGLITDYYGNLGKLVAAPEPRVPTRDSQNALGRKQFAPNKASIAEAILSITPILGDVLSAKDTAASLSEGNYGEAALNGVGLLPFVPSLAKVPMVAGAIKAFHGTPHTFKPEPGLPFGRFKKEAIGSGEGAAAYGHGASYSAENPEVAQEYFHALRQKHRTLTDNSVFTVKGEPISSGHPGRMIYDRLATNGIEPTVVQSSQRLQEARSILPADSPVLRAKENAHKRLLSIADGLKDSDINRVIQVDEFIPQGHVLELSHEWPDAAREAADPLSKEHLLDWDKPLSEQSEKVKGALKTAKTGAIRSEAIANDNLFGSELYRKMGGSDRAASEYLHSIGIPGIKYLDGSSRGAGEGTHNFVMFEPEYTKIVARDGIPAKGLLSE